LPRPYYGQCSPRCVPNEGPDLVADFDRLFEASLSACNIPNQG
jgi:hypothetical protein